MTVEALRDDVERMLRFIAADMRMEQSLAQESEKSRGLGPQLPPGQNSAAHDHGLARATDRFSMMEMVSEYRALRASVTRMWLDAAPITHASVMQLVRFNEAVDQILAESAVRFSAKLDGDADLFTASIGHDLRNPLSAVTMGARTLLSSHVLSDQERNVAARIERSAVAIAAMLNDLTDFTRTRLGSIIGYKLEQRDLGELCREVVEEVRVGYPEHPIEFTQAGETTADVDTKRMRQLLSNLVANAIQHGSEDGVVTVRVARRAEYVVIEVHNFGPAIEPTECREIFDPLRRGRTVGTGDTTGLGLGLYIARRIAVAHGGSLEVSSSDVDGTTFVTSLPAATASESHAMTSPAM